MRVLKVQVRQCWMMFRNLYCMVLYCLVSCRYHSQSNILANATDAIYRRLIVPSTSASSVSHSTLLDSFQPVQYSPRYSNHHDTCRCMFHLIDTYFIYLPSSLSFVSVFWLWSFPEWMEMKWTNLWWWFLIIWTSWERAKTWRGQGRGRKIEKGHKIFD